jgi:hypothetical protein
MKECRRAKRKEAEIPQHVILIMTRIYFTASSTEMEMNRSNAYGKAGGGKLLSCCKSW